MNNKQKISIVVVLLFIFSIKLVTAQDSIIVKGKVVSKKNHPIENVSVSIEGTSDAPVLTDSTGEFSLLSPSGDRWLIVTPLGGYKSQRFFLNARENIIISLSDLEMKSSDDLIHAVNNKIKRRDLVGSFHDVRLNSLDESSVQTIDQYFQGRIPGLHVTNHSGMPGMGANVQVRGLKSMHTNNSPLYVIDGMPIEQPELFQTHIDGYAYNPLVNLEPSDISSITVLNDPVTTSLYGTKGSNGVVLIQTIEPVATKTIIDVSYRTGIHTVPDDIPQLNSVQYKSLANELLSSSGKNEEYFEEEYPGLYLLPGEENYFRYQHNTNWQNVIFSNSTYNNYFVRVRGGGETTRFGLSVGRIDDKGIYDDTRFSRTNFRFNSLMDIAAWFRLSINANLSSNVIDLRESAISNNTNPILNGLSKSPLMNPFQYDEEGNRLILIDDVDELGISNPYVIINDFEGTNKNYRFISSIKGEADILPNLKLNSLLGLNFNSSKESVFMPNIGMDLYFEGEAKNVSQAVNNYLYSIYNDSYLSFEKRVRNQEFSIMSGVRINTNSLQTDWGESKNSPENDQYRTLGSGESNLKRVGGDNAVWNWLSVYGNIHYALKDKYLFSAGGSFDYSTRNGKEANDLIMVSDLPFGTFYSVGAAWRLSSEPFMKNISGLDELKLRISYGISGNDDIGDYSSQAYYSVVKYRETTGLVPGSLANKTLRFEETNQINAGIDISLWGSRTNMVFNVYESNTGHLLQKEEQESFVGFNYRLTNKGTINNRGLEVQLYQRIIDNTSFKWDGIITLSGSVNEISGIGEQKIITPFHGGEFVSISGEPVNSFYGYKFEGVFSTYEEAMEANLVNNKGEFFGAGDAKYADISGPQNVPDGVIDSHDKTIIGSASPDYFGSLINEFRYRRWYLNFIVQFVYGNEVYNYVRYNNERMTDLSNQSQTVLHRWQKEGDKTDVPRALWNDPIGNSVFSSRWIEDGSYLRLKNVTIGYSIPQKFLVFRNADFFVTATNLISIHKYLGYDPEFSYSYHPMEQGIDYGLMPQHKSFIIGVKFGL